MARKSRSKWHSDKPDVIIFVFMLIVAPLLLTAGLLYYSSYNDSSPVVGSDIATSGPYIFGRRAAQYDLGIAGNPYSLEEDRVTFLKGYLYELDMNHLIRNDIPND